MKQIFKYNLKIQDFQNILMTIGAEIISVQSQRETIQLWAIIDQSVGYETRHFEIYMTGYEIRNNGPRKFLGTIQMLNGNFVYHVFEYLGI